MFGKFGQRQANNSRAVISAFKNLKTALKKENMNITKENVKKLPKMAWIYILCGGVIMLGILVFVTPVLRYF